MKVRLTIIHLYLLIFFSLLSNIQIFNIFKKPECKITFDEVPGRHKHKLTDKDDKSARYPTFFNGEDITGTIEIKIHSSSEKHKGIKAEIHGILEKYGTIKKTKEFLNLSADICRAGELNQEKSKFNFSFQNVKMQYESYKGDYATIKYYVKIIIKGTYKNSEYEKEFAVVNPYDSSILQQNDEPIKMQVGMKDKISMAIYFQHRNYNCRGTLKGFIFFNYLNINLKFMEVQIVRRELVFGDKKCEPAYVARYELIDGVPNKNERIPVRFFLKSYNLTPTYSNIDNIFCVKYYLNLVIATEDDNRYFKQKEICLFRLYKERRYNYNNSNYQNDEHYNDDEVFITEPIYEEDYSLDYRPAFGRPKNRKIHPGYYDIMPILPSMNDNESNDFGFNDSYDNNYNRNNENNNNSRGNNNNNYNNRNNNDDDNYMFEDNYNNDDNYNDYDNNNNYNRRNNNYNNNNNSNNRNKMRMFDDGEDNNYNYNNNQNQNNINNNRAKKKIKMFGDDEEDNDYNNYNDRNQNNRNRQNNYNYNNNQIRNDNNIEDDDDNYNNNYNNNNKRGGKREEININNPSSYYSIKTNNNKNSNKYNAFFEDDLNEDDSNNNVINTNNNNNNDNNNSKSHRNNLMKARISNEEDFKDIMNSLDKNANKEDLKKNIFG